MSAKKETELQSFIDNVNKKDKLNGKKIVFNFVKRKRKQPVNSETCLFYRYPANITGSFR